MQYNSTYAGDAGDRVRDPYATSVSCLFPFGVESIIVRSGVFTVFGLLCADAVIGLSSLDPGSTRPAPAEELYITSPVPLIFPSPSRNGTNRQGQGVRAAV